MPTNSRVVGTSAQSWLSLSISGGASFQFVWPYSIHVTPAASNTPGTYNGTINIAGSTFAPDNKAVNVTMSVTTQPIAQASVSQLNVQLAQGAPPLVPPFSPSVGLVNTGQGTLVAQAPTVSTSSCGSSWLTSISGALSFDVSGLSPGVCKGSIAISSNAANGTITVPVTLTVVPKGNPSIGYQGVLDNATFVPGDAVTPGDVMVVKGDQLSFSAYTPGSAPPLPTQLADTSVLVNGSPAPLFYTSYGQIAFQMPVNTPLGTALVQVKRSDGSTSNTVTSNVIARAPKLLLLGIGSYGAIVNADGCDGAASCLLGGSLPLSANYSQPGYPAYPAHAGDTLTIYAIGLGQTNPSVASGAPTPSTPPFAPLASTPQINFGGGLFPVMATPVYAGLTPTYAGLYQINVQVPSGTQKGVIALTLGFPDGTLSNSVTIAVQ
jgi:uncharacterized protein (TIGR03437 family)